MTPAQLNKYRARKRRDAARYRKAHAPELRNRARKYYSAHLDQCRAKRRARDQAWREAHPGVARAAAASRRFRRRHPEKLLQENAFFAARNEASRRLATQHRELWGPVEDAALKSSKAWIQPTFANLTLLANELGRTIFATRARRYLLIKEGP